MTGRLARQPRPVAAMIRSWMKAFAEHLVLLGERLRCCTMSCTIIVRIGSNRRNTHHPRTSHAVARGGAKVPFRLLLRIQPLRIRPLSWLYV